MSPIKWFVLRTNPQCEDRAKASLEASGFITYLPKMRKETRHPRTKAWRVKEYPLFTRYIFVGVQSAGDLGICRACDGVEAIIPSRQTPYRVPNHEVEGFIEAQGNGKFDQMRRSSITRPFRVDDPIKVEEGPFAGFSGNVTNLRGRQHIEIMISIFGRDTAVSIEERHVKAA